MKKKERFLFTLLMAIVMMAMSPAKVWADEPDARLAQLTLSAGVTAKITDNDSHPWVKVTPGEKLNDCALPGEITNGLCSNIVGVNNTTSTTTITLTATKDFKLSFKVYCSSESGCDYCQVFVDNVEKCKLSGAGGADYTFTAFLSSGEHTIRLFYKKDSSVNSGIDSGVIYDFKTVSVCDTHTWGDWTQTSAPTCTEKGSHYHTCSVCEITKTEDIPALGHTTQEVAGKAAGRCDNPGHLAHYHCTRCDMDFADQVGTLPTTVSLLITSHVSLDENGLCTVCHVGNPATLSEDGYYLLSTAADLAWFRDFVNTGVTEGENTTHPYAASNARLMADIDMSSICHSADAENSIEKLSWIPIGIYNYLGTFDGNSHEVTNLYIDTDNSPVGFIGYLGTSDQQTGAAVKNLTVRGSVKSSEGCVGGIVGRSYGLLSGCTNYATVEGDNLVGGIAGTSTPWTFTAKIENCANRGAIKSSRYCSIAGIVGSANNTEISNCGNFAKVESPSYKVGGIVGENNDYPLTIRNCTNSGEISSTYSDYCSVGGILGLSNNTTVNIEGCKNTGKVTGVGEYIAGIIGQATSTINIKNCGNEGTISSSIGNQTSWDTYSYAGGIAGYISAYDGKAIGIDGCYNIGSVYAAGAYVGGLVASINTDDFNSYITNCYTTGNITSITTGNEPRIGGAFGCLQCNASNIYSTATITKNAATTENVGAFAGYINKITLTNCFYDSDKTELVFNGSVYSSTIDASVNGGKSKAEFASGEICYLFNGSRSAGTAENPLVWYQAIGRDAYPTFDQNQYAIVKYDAPNGYYNDPENFASIEIQDGEAYDAKLKRTATELTYKRTFVDNDFNCLYVPFEAPVSYFTDCSIYAINMFQQHDNDGDGQVDDVTLEVIKAPEGATIKANHPYLITYDGTGTGVQTFTFNDVTIAAAACPEYKCSSMNADYVFQGMYTDDAPTASEYYTLVYDETKQKVVLGTSNDGVGMQRWYMAMEARDSQFGTASTSNKAKSISIVIAGEDEEATGIGEVSDFKSQVSGKFIENGKIVIVRNGRKYNLNGQIIK